MPIEPGRTSVRRPTAPPRRARPEADPLVEQPAVDEPAVDRPADQPEPDPQCGPGGPED